MILENQAGGMDMLALEEMKPARVRIAAPFFRLLSGFVIAMAAVLPTWKRPRHFERPTNSPAA
ncbi:hypothetical protein [Rhizobium leguminosarum]|uniref:hypothetical protein n=1 Tax=Rhizobium leguminosarum TaxID=384 RepID=UPI000FEC3A66|nr:hypothetical protein [Rhizobium leguminosarum]RWX34544.1 hypothetical protein EHI43_12635 [Rhizobium leguminosarum]